MDEGERGGATRGILGGVKVVECGEEEADAGGGECHDVDGPFLVDDVERCDLEGAAVPEGGLPGAEAGALAVDGRGGLDVAQAGEVLAEVEDGDDGLLGEGVEDAACGVDDAVDEGDGGAELEEGGDEGGEGGGGVVDLAAALGEPAVLRLVDDLV